MSGDDTDVLVVAPQCVPTLERNRETFQESPVLRRQLGERTPDVGLFFGSFQEILEFEHIKYVGQCQGFVIGAEYLELWTCLEFLKWYHRTSVGVRQTSQARYHLATSRVPCQSAMLCEGTASSAEAGWLDRR